MVSQVVTTNVNGMYAYNVQWKLRGEKIYSKASYIAGSVFKLLRLLEQAEGINRENVDTLIIHQHNKNGTTIEVLALENGQENKTAKPVLRLPAPSTPASEPVVIKAGFSYKAYPAVSMKEN